MKVLILGAYGMLGHKLFSSLSERYDVYATARARNDAVRLTGSDDERIIDGVDAFDYPSINDAIDRINPDIMINCIGLIKQLGPTVDPLTMMYLNSVLPHRLVNSAKENGARLIHFSTDCVFSGKKGMYTLRDRPDAEDLYGKTKFLGEVANNNSLTIRSSIIGPELGSKNGLLEWFLSRSGMEIKGYRSAIYSGLTTLEMSRVVSMIIGRHPDLHGVYQVASTPISKFDLLTLINEKMNLNVTIEPDYAFACDRSLDGSEFNRATGYRPPSWSEMIDEMIIDMKNEEGMF